MAVYKWRYITGDSHTRVKLFVGPDEDHLAFSGELCMKSTEWRGFLSGLMVLAELPGEEVPDIQDGTWLPPVEDKVLDM